MRLLLLLDWLLNFELQGGSSLHNSSSVWSVPPCNSKFVYVCSPIWEQEEIIAAQILNLLVIRRIDRPVTQSSWYICSPIWEQEEIIAVQILNFWVIRRIDRPKTHSSRMEHLSLPPWNSWFAGAEGFFAARKGCFLAKHHSLPPHDLSWAGLIYWPP